MRQMLSGQPDLINDEEMCGKIELSELGAINLLLGCSAIDANFYKSLYRKLPRVVTKMVEQYHNYVKKRQMLAEVFNMIDTDGSGAVDQKELERFFKITGGFNRVLNYSDAQIALMTEEDKELLLKTDDLTVGMDISGDGSLSLSEFMRFFMSNNPDGTPEDLEGHLHDLGFLNQTRQLRFSHQNVDVIAHDAFVQMSEAVHEENLSQHAFVEMSEAVHAENLSQHIVMVDGASQEMAPG